MSGVEFEIPDDEEPTAGFAIILTKDLVSGERLTTYGAFGDISPEHLMGLLTAACDQVRWEFRDIAESQMIGLLEEATGSEEDEDGGD